MRNKMEQEKEKCQLLKEMKIQTNTDLWNRQVAETTKILETFQFPNLHLTKGLESHISTVIKVSNKSTLKAQKHLNWQLCNKHHWKMKSKNWQMGNKLVRKFRFCKGRYLTRKANRVWFQTTRVQRLLVDSSINHKANSKILKTSWNKTFH